VRYDIKWFEEHGFQPCSWIDSDGKQPHYYRFNVYRNNYDVRIDCEIIIYHNGAFDIDVYDGSFGKAKYAPWYAGEDNDVVRKIKQKIDEKTSQLGLYN